MRIKREEEIKEMLLTRQFRHDRKRLAEEENERMAQLQVCTFFIRFSDIMRDDDSELPYCVRNWTMKCGSASNVVSTHSIWTLESVAFTLEFSHPVTQSLSVLMDVFHLL